jgi:hypothetical protein
MPLWTHPLTRATGGLLLALACASATAGNVLGTRPAHMAADPGPVENDQAIGARVWAPGIDDGYVPQGITFVDDHVLISSYKSTDPKQGRGPCRVYRIDVRSGRTAGQFDLPDDCGHAGGAVYVGKGILVVADTRRLYKIDMGKAFADGNTRGALLGTIDLAGQVKGSFVDFDGASILVGSSEKDPAKAHAFFLPYSLFDRTDHTAIDERAASRSFPIAANAQGAAFDRDGKLWLSFSNSKHGMLQKVDPITGAVLARHDMVIGIEDIGFDPHGTLWSVSEAGSLRWSRWSTRFPVIFSVDTGKLQ